MAEWFVSKIYKGKIAKSHSEEGWDVIIRGKKIQIKAHAEARFTILRPHSKNKFDKLIIIVFSSDYYIKEFYEVPHDVAYEKVKGINLRWKAISDFKKHPLDLPNQEIVSLFMK